MPVSSTLINARLRADENLCPVALLRLREQSEERGVVETRHNQVRGLKGLCGTMIMRHADDQGTGLQTCRNTRRTVLQHHRASRGDTEPLDRSSIDFGIRLTSRN